MGSRPFVRTLPAQTHESQRRVELGGKVTSLETRPSGEVPFQETEGTAQSVEIGMYASENISFLLVQEQLKRFQNMKLNINSPVKEIQFQSVDQTHIPLGGRLREFLSNWQKITTDPKILEYVKGYVMEFMENPVQNWEIRAPKFSKSENICISTEINEMLKKGAIELVNNPTPDQVLSHLFVRPKKNGGMRPILNLKSLNKFVKYQHFKMEGFQSVKNTIQRGDWMCTLDLKDAYFCIPIHDSHKKYLRFSHEGIIYQYKSLPFGLGSGPRTFTKIMKPIVGILRRIGVRLIIYLDDILILNQNKEGLIKDRNKLVWLLHHLGWLINWEKSVTVPTQVLDYLGMTINSIEMKIYLPERKIQGIVQKCQTILSNDKCSIHELASLIGMLTATAEAVIPASLYVRELQMTKTKFLLHNPNYQTLVTMPTECRVEIRWWIHHLRLWNGKHIITPGPDLILETDASLKGWGASCPTLNQKSSRMGGSWVLKKRDFT